MRLLSVLLLTSVLLAGCCGGNSKSKEVVAGTPDNELWVDQIGDTLLTINNPTILGFDGMGYKRYDAYFGILVDKEKGTEYIIIHCGDAITIVPRLDSLNKNSYIKELNKEDNVWGTFD